MHVNKISIPNNIKPININIQKTNTNTNKAQNIQDKTYSYAALPADFQYNANNINFGNKRWIVNIPLIEFENYKAMPSARKERFRKLYKEFDKLIDDSQKKILLSIDKNPEYMRIPLQTEENMDNFIKVAKMYSQYKDHPIICLGRSPKWFLNASLWMKDGIEDYKFVAFSGRWYWIYKGTFGDNSSIERQNDRAPNKAQEKAYRKYLKNIQADPISIIKRTQDAGKKTIITDYVDTGKGLTSFLEVLSNYAQDLGVLDEFGHSIEILAIGNNDYRQKATRQSYVSDPHIYMPPLLEPYDIATTAWGTGQIITQNYYDVDDKVFMELLINQNPNECRSTYYPCYTWTIYKPDKFKTGMIKDINKIKELVNTLQSEKPVFIFEPVMSAYRNLLNFRILDGLNERGLLKDKHRSKN